VVRNDLLQEWQRTLPEDAPNYFLINIRPESWPGISALFERELGTSPDFLPLIRGRMTQVNGQAIEDLEFGNPRGRSFGRRETNLTWTSTLPESNRVRAGQWWGPDYDGPLQISLDEDVARDMGVKIGDVFTFDIGGEEIKAPLTSLRFIEWDSFAPNFYFVLSPGEVHSLPQTYLSSVYVPMERRQVLNQLLQEYPGITLLDLEVVLAQVRSVIDKASLAVQYVFLFTLLAGVVVLLAAIQVTHDERRFESALLHTLGARRSKILQGVAVEFVALGSLAGLLAALGATAVGWVLAENVFDLDYRLDPSLWVIGVLAGATIVGFTGTLAARKAVNEPPIVVLRQG
jgi:putative ABC transport system permease protein